MAGTPSQSGSAFLRTLSLCQLSLPQSSAVGSGAEPAAGISTAEWLRFHPARMTSMSFSANCLSAAAIAVWLFAISAEVSACTEQPLLSGDAIHSQCSTSSSVSSRAVFRGPAAAIVFHSDSKVNAERRTCEGGCKHVPESAASRSGTLCSFLVLSHLHTSN